MKAFTDVDRHSRGSLPLDDWVSGITALGFEGPESALKATFRYLDRENSGMLSSADLDLLTIFDSERVLHDLTSFVSFLIGKYGSVQSAYLYFRNHADEFENGVACKDFLQGYKTCGFRGEVDPRVWFQFVDVNDRTLFEIP